MNKLTMRKLQVNIRMPDDLRKKLKVIAKNKDRSVNYIIVQALKEYAVKKKLRPQLIEIDMASKFVSKFLGKTDMNSISVIEAINSTSLKFHGQQLLTATFEGVAYVAMRPIVENIGIDWAGQSVKLNKQKDKFGCCDIAKPSKGGIQKML